MHVEIVPCLADNYAYLLVSDSGTAVVIDPSETEPVLAAVERLGASLVGIWLTHHHHDHVGGVEGLVRHDSALVVHASAYDVEHGRAPRAKQALNTGDPLWFASRRMRVLQVPGHTLGALAYLADGKLFSGDTLFSAGCGRMFEGTPEQMQRSLDSLRTLPGETELYPGHEYTVRNLEFAASIEPNNLEIRERLERARTTRAQDEPTVPSVLTEELATNPFLRWDEPTVIAKAIELGSAGVEAHQVFAALRRAKDTF